MVQQNGIVSQASMLSNNAGAIKAYGHTKTIQTETLSNEDKRLALSGWYDTFPQYLPEGYNGIAAGVDITEPNNGIVNLHGFYDQNGETPQVSIQFVA